MLKTAISCFCIFGSLANEKSTAPVMLDELISQGTIAIDPTEGIAGQFGTWTVTYTVGETGIAKGGGLRVQLPDAWHAGPRNSANRLQATDPADDHYVISRTSRSDVQLKTIVESERKNRLIKHAKLSLDGRSERYVFVVRVIVVKGRLQKGDVISMVYGDRSGGSKGYRAAAISTGPLPILVAVDEQGQGQFKLHTQRPTITAKPGRPVEMWVHAPSQAQINQPIELLVSMVDKQSNPVHQPAEIHIEKWAGDAEYPRKISLLAGKGYVRFKVKPTAAGILRFRADCDSFRLSAASNPIRVTAKLPEMKIYWGDLHSHTHFSWDGVGDDAFDYARHVTGLDFYAMTDHSQAVRNGKTRGLSETYWAEYTALTEKYHDPGKFVTLHAYECSFGKPYGHHNVFFRDKPGPLMFPSKTTLPKLWEALSEGNAITIPHHTGKFPGGIDFSIHDPRFRRNFEIYSGHGLSEAYNPKHPLAFEQSLFTSDSKSLPSPTYAQDVWMAGLKLSTIASSDDHRAHPGLPHYGLVAVMSTGLTRNEIFEGLYQRRTYGTTGAKIILDFTLNDVGMGQVAKVTGPPTLHVRAIGTDEIEWVELLRFTPSGQAFEVIQTWRPSALEFAAEFADSDWKSGAIYYMRLKQKRLIRDRTVMAWSSPIWTQPAK